MWGGVRPTSRHQPIKAALYAQRRERTKSFGKLSHINDLLRSASEIVIKSESEPFCRADSQRNLRLPIEIPEFNVGHPSGIAPWKAATRIDRARWSVAAPNAPRLTGIKCSALFSSFLADWEERD